MGSSFFFYDLETSGFSARKDRVMQFAGQRTDLQLKPVGEPFNILIRLTDDILPSPDAVLITGITPQMTRADGITEAEFLHLFTEQIATPGTIFVGYNTVRFDDEFMRLMHYRNFYDPYEWQWQDGRSKWDMLDVVRMTRALRPDDIKWPFDIHGKPTNRLELLTALNKLEHEAAHDALSDVTATIAVARLIRNKQTKLFDYLLDMRDKKRVAELVNKNQPFVYTSGRFSAEYQKTTVAVKLCDHPKKQAAFVFNLRYDPSRYATMSPEELADAWRYKKDAGEEERLPVKSLQYNHCPAVAPLGVLDDASRERLQIDLKQIAKHHAILQTMDTLPERLVAAMELLDAGQQASLVATEYDVDGAIYDGFFNDQDKQAMRVVRAATAEELSSLNLHFKDSRLEALLPLYKARNHPAQLTSEERDEWERYRTAKLLSGGQHSALARYLAQLQQILQRGGLTGHQEYLIEELKLYAQSIMPEEEL